MKGVRISYLSPHPVAASCDTCWINHQKDIVLQLLEKEGAYEVAQWWLFSCLGDYPISLSRPLVAFVPRVSRTPVLTITLSLFVANDP